MNTGKRIFWISVMVLILVLNGGQSAYAQEKTEPASKTVKEEAGSLLVEAQSADNFRYEEGHLYIYGGTVIVRLSPAADYATESIEVSGYAELVLDGVRILAEEGPAVRVLPGAEVEIRLSEGEKEQEQQEAPVIDNYLRGADGYAGIEVGTLPGAEEENALPASLRIKGKGYLTAVGGEGAAAIGASLGQESCGRITLEEGNINAIAGRRADAIGLSADSSAGPVCAPVICDKVTSLIAFSDSDSRTISPAEPAQSTEEDASRPNDLSAAFVLTAEFAQTGEESGAQDTVRVRDTLGKSETSLDMPEGYNRFTVKVESGLEYMIERGGDLYAGVESEEMAEELGEDGQAPVTFTGTNQYDQCFYLIGAVQDPVIDIEVRGYWKDEENEDGTRPGSVTVTLYANGKETGRTVTLSEENDWCACFEEMDVYSDLVRQSYSVVEERLDGYTGLISGSDLQGYVITNMHRPLPEGRSAEEEIELRSNRVGEKGRVVATVLTTKVSRSMPARTSTTIRKTRSVKTGDSSGSIFWCGVLLITVSAAFLWMRIEQNREK